MKIIARAENDVLMVEMTTTEMMRAAGYSNRHHEEFWKAVPKSFRGQKPSDFHRASNFLRVGFEINVIAPNDYVRRFTEQEDAVIRNAAMLRALADMVEDALPSRSIPPIEDDPEEDPDFAEVE